MLAGCASGPHDLVPRAEALPRLFVANGNLGWGGITLGMTRADAERALGRSLRVEHDIDAEMCGEHYSRIELHGRSVRIAWTTASVDGAIEVISVPYGGRERTASDGHLSEAARTAVPELVIDADGDAHPSFLVLRSDHHQAVNLKSSGEGLFFVTAAACVD